MDKLFFLNKILTGNSLEVITSLPDQSVDCCVTSPPYWGLRDYENRDQLGMEKTPEEYITNLVTLFREVKRVLKNNGTIWVNIGDSYASSAGIYNYDNNSTTKNQGYLSNGAKAIISKHNKIVGDLKPKDLVGIPWMLAFALRSDGWYLRQDIIWSKPNCMPEPVKDRCTKSHEYIFMLSKSAKYYYDSEAIRTPATFSTVKRVSQDVGNQSGSIANGGLKSNGPMKAVVRVLDKQRGHSRRHAGFNDRWDKKTMEELVAVGANKRSVWTVSPSQYKEAHFATYPEKLIVDCIKAGCPVDGIVLDPFMGAGTTALVASKLNRNYVGIELNEKYVSLAKNRLDKELGLFKK